MEGFEHCRYGFRGVITLFLAPNPPTQIQRKKLLGIFWGVGFAVREAALSANVTVVSGPLTHQR
jgi:hypothetical protein